MIEITIDELVMRGLSPKDSHAAADALEARLAELARGGDRGGEGDPTSDGDVTPRDEAFRRTPSVVAPATEPAALGEAVAVAVWGAVSSGGRR
ncbi:MAG: hypothetical protein QOJ25_134 [Solirubrobacteraceae bacterium]|jgi:hypothetical protein|nr:hypothetical protein [Solirubrobacteraceae bacterium]